MNHVLAVEEDVQINDPGSPFRAIAPAHAPFDLLEHPQKPLRRQDRPDLGHGIDKVRLVLRPDRLGPIEGGDAQQPDSRNRPHLLQGIAATFYRVAQVGADPHEGDDPADFLARLHPNPIVAPHPPSSVQDARMS
jgi:hypothetical protein